MRVEYRVLGPLEVLLDGEPVAVPAGRCHVLPATLLLRPNRFITDNEVRLGRLDEAEHALRFALDGMVRFGDRENEGDALRRAVELWRDLRDDRLGEVEQQLAELEAG